MRNVFLFSGYIMPFFRHVKFAILILRRFFKIVFHRDRTIQCIYLDYSTRYVFQNSLLVIRFRFKNVLWVRVLNVKKASDSAVIILNLKNISQQSIDFSVKGFFKNKIYKIPIRKEYQLLKGRFETRLNNTDKFNAEFEEIKHPLVQMEMGSADIKIPIVKAFFPQIKVMPTIYNQNDLL